MTQWKTRKGPGLPLVRRLFGRMRSHTLVGAVHPFQAQGVLDYLGMEQALANGVLTCAECGGALTREKLAAARKGDDDVLLCCSNLACLEMFHER